MKSLFFRTDDGRLIQIDPFHEPEPDTRRIAPKGGHTKPCKPPRPPTIRKRLARKGLRVCARCHQPRRASQFRFAHSTICIPCLDEYFQEHEG